MSALPTIYVDRTMPPGFEEMFTDRAALIGPEVSALVKAQGVIASGSVWDGPRMDTAPLLQVISRAGIGFDAVDLGAATERGVVVCNAPASPTVSTAEHTMALLLHVAKSLSANQRRLRGHIGDYYVDNEGIELAGRTLGVVGYGPIGRRVVKAARGLDMEVLAHDPYLDPNDEDVELVSFSELLERSDAVSAHCPLTDETHELFNRDAFAKMRRGSLFINAARGGVVDQDALVEALDSGHIAGAGLDVTVPEPLPIDHPLQGRDNVIITPHIASATDLGRRRMYRAALDNAMTCLNGNRVTTCVNPEVYDQPELRFNKAQSPVCGTVRSDNKAQKI
ncbi:MAG: hydroxyacid dehydrogenase [Acidimicrobiaceae bacterium]|nr:hydroxyacid dehydrogenase [Acidimicrobiaceae bacterium]